MTFFNVYKLLGTKFFTNTVLYMCIIPMFLKFTCVKSCVYLYVPKSQNHINPNFFNDLLKLVDCAILIEPVHESSNNIVCVISKASDQPAHLRSLIRAFVCRFEYSTAVKLLTENHLEFLSLN